VYFAEATTGKQGLPQDRSADYPDTRIVRMPSGVQWSVDDKNSVVEVDHPSGTYVKIYFDGTIEVGSAKEIDLLTSDDVSVGAGGKVALNAGDTVIVNTP